MKLVVLLQRVKSFYFFYEQVSSGMTEGTFRNGSAKILKAMEILTVMELSLLFTDRVKATG